MSDTTGREALAEVLRRSARGHLGLYLPAGVFSVQAAAVLGHLAAVLADAATVEAVRAGVMRKVLQDQHEGRQRDHIELTLAALADRLGAHTTHAEEDDRG